MRRRLRRPVQHLAPECIGKKHFSEKSDVCAFCVMIWEVTHRRDPYAGEEAFEIAMSVVQGKRLEIDEPLVEGRHYLAFSSPGECVDACERLLSDATLAVFAAAFVGNMYYHLLDLGEALALADFESLWATLQSRLLYCFLLALGIFVSMRRSQQQARRAFLPALPQHLLRLGLVWTFYAVIHIWAQKTDASFVQRTQFFANLLGIT